MIQSRLHILMGEKKIRSIRQLSEETKITRLSLTRLYDGIAKGIEFDTLVKLCDYFGCTVGDLIVYEKEKKE